MKMVSKFTCCDSELVIYLQAYFVTIATILGTGILGLPVTLTHSGFYPFLISFLVDAFAQSLLIHFFMELLQLSVASQYHGKGEESMPLNTMLEEDIYLESDEDDGQTNGAIMKGKMQHIREIPLVQAPNLHLLGKLFLGCGLQQAFDILIILQFIAILICYALAGSEAYAQLIGVEHFYVIPLFVWVLTLAIVFALQLIQPVISILTFVKGSLLLGTAAVTFYVGLAVAEKINNDFKYVGGPFLMGTVALGGVCNTMPYTFEKVPFKKKPIFNYRLAVQLGLWTCVVLNILWCWAVLDIVPQTIEMACSSRTISGHFNMNSTSVIDVCNGELSLEGAASKGEISTIPLTKLLQLDHPHFTWVAVLIEVFIVVSISVSYLTIGTALHHTLSGIVVSFNMRKSASTMSRIKNKKKFPKEWLVKTGISMAAFTIVFVVAMLDPEGFVDILEKLVSFTLNFEVGIFIFCMLIFARKEPFKHLEIPLPVSKCLHHLVYLLPLFFNFAVVYDIYSTIADIVNPRHYPSVVLNISMPGVSTASPDLLSNATGVMSTSTVALHT